jgi:outer membrane protein OmpA-like peptidoglycan-associated protein
VEQREKLIAIVDKADLPSINIRILFDYDSDRINGNSFDVLNEIGDALNDSALAGSKILLNGHTDASGSRAYNQDLSERRAMSVKRYLSEKLFILADRLVVAGFGEDRLRDPDDPDSGTNRRVEIVNLGE